MSLFPPQGRFVGRLRSRFVDEIEQKIEKRVEFRGPEIPKKVGK
jgi:hypothetical protein